MRNLFSAFPGDSLISVMFLISIKTTLTGGHTTPLQLSVQRLVVV